MVALPDADPDPRDSRPTFRWQNGAFIIAMLGTLLAFVVLAIGSKTDFVSHFDTRERQVRRRRPCQTVIARGDAPSAAPRPGQPERHAADAVLDPGLHDVELLVGLHVGRAEERVQPPPPAADHVRRAGLGLAPADHRRACCSSSVTGYNFMYAVNSRRARRTRSRPGPSIQFLAALVVQHPVLTVLHRSARSCSGRCRP